MLTTFTISRPLGALVACILIAGSALAQAESSKPRIFERFDGTHCETTKAELDLIAERADQDGLIIIIASLGTKEASRKLNRRRMHMLADYLQMTRSISAERIVTAEGERVRGLGRVEIYVKGRLFTVFTVNRNKDLARGCSTA
jgi:hypothetical protein